MNDSLDDLDDTDSRRDRMNSLGIFAEQLYDIAVAFVSYSVFAFLICISVLFWLHLGRLAIEQFSR